MQRFSRDNYSIGWLFNAVNIIRSAREQYLKVKAEGRDAVAFVSIDNNPFKHNFVEWFELLMQNVREHPLMNKPVYNLHKYRLCIERTGTFFAQYCLPINLCEVPPQPGQLSINDMPPEIIYMIMDYLTGIDALHFCQTNTYYYAILQDDHYWSKRNKGEAVPSVSEFHRFINPDLKGFIQVEVVGHMPFYLPPNIFLYDFEQLKPILEHRLSFLREPNTTYFFAPYGSIVDGQHIHVNRASYAWKDVENSKRGGYTPEQLKEICILHKIKYKPYGKVKRDLIDAIK